MILDNGCYVLCQGDKEDVKLNENDDEHGSDDGTDGNDSATREAKAAQVSFHFTTCLLHTVYWLATGPQKS